MIDLRTPGPLPAFKGDQACYQHPDEWVFKEGAEPSTRELRLKDVCGTCPYVLECRRYALHHDVQGIWGGLAHRDRVRMRTALGITAAPISNTY